MKLSDYVTAFAGLSTWYRARSNVDVKSLRRYVVEHTVSMHVVCDSSRYLGPPWAKVGTTVLERGWVNRRLQALGCVRPP